jgi:hypothetical protein
LTDTTPNTAPDPSMGPEVIDYSAGPHSDNRPRLDRIYQAAGHIVRVEVVYDELSSRGSRAEASLLNSGLTWTPLVSSPASRWHSKIFNRLVPNDADADAVDDVALYRDLVHRMAMIADELAARAAYVMDAAGEDSP